MADNILTPMADTSLEHKEQVLEKMECIFSDYAELAGRTTDFVVTRLKSDNSQDKNTTYNFYVSISIPKPATEIQQPS